jgi:acyl-CoA thioester hydrolase
VRPEHLDGVGHVNNVVYIQWMQDVAAAHWRAVARPEDQARLVWVVTRHEIDYLAAGLPGDRLVARTWVGSWTAATCVRFIEIRRPADGKVLVRARTIWAALDAKTGRPTRIASETAAAFVRAP